MSARSPGPGRVRVHLLCYDARMTWIALLFIFGVVGLLIFAGWLLIRRMDREDK